MSAFSTNCTLPLSPVRLVTSPNTRGTFDILWTCLTTLFLCTWSVQHPNVPVQNRKRKWSRILVSVLRKIAMMLFNLLVPEFLILKAILDLTSALALSQRISKRSISDGSPWSTKHSFFVNMGGFVIQFTDDIPNVVTATGPVTSTSKSPEKKPLRPPTSTSSIPPWGGEAGEKLRSTVAEMNSKDLRSSHSMASSTANARPTTLLTRDPNAINSSSSSITEPNPTNLATLSIKEANPKKSTTPSIKPGGPQNTKGRKVSVIDKRICPMITRRLSSLQQNDRNSILVRKVLEDMKEKTLAGEDTGFDSGRLYYLILNLLPLRGMNWALDGPQLILAREMGVLSQIPEISEDEIDEKANSDSIVKFLAVLQAGWQIIQLIARWAKSLPSSQVEVVTVAFSICAFCTYIISWNKPQDVQMPRYVRAERYATREEIFALAETGPAYIADVSGRGDYAIPAHTIHLNFDGLHREENVGYWGWFGGVCCGITFGLLHCSAWNFHFPNPVERLLWRTSSTITSSVPIMYGVLMLWNLGLGHLQQG
jgi:hypothetical protein